MGDGNLVIPNEDYFNFSNSDVQKIAAVAYGEAAIQVSMGLATPFEAYGSIVDNIINRLTVDTRWGPTLDDVLVADAYDIIAERPGGVAQLITELSQDVLSVVTDYIAARASGAKSQIKEHTSYHNTEIYSTTPYYPEFNYEESSDPVLIGGGSWPHFFYTLTNDDGSFTTQVEEYSITVGNSTTQFTPEGLPTLTTKTLIDGNYINTVYDGFGHATNSILYSEDGIIVAAQVNSQWYLCFDMNGQIQTCQTPTTVGAVLNYYVRDEDVNFRSTAFSIWELILEENFNNSLASEFQEFMESAKAAPPQWAMISLFSDSDGNEFYGLDIGYGDEVTVSYGNQVLLVLGTNIDVDGSQVDDIFYLAELGSQIFGASGIDGVTFSLMDEAIDASLDRGEAAYRYSDYLVTDLSNIENLTGTNYNDILEGRSNNNNLSGLSGDDILLGKDGDDLLIGGSGNDKLYGNNDDDILYGDSGEDELRGGGGDDKLYGGDDDDELFGASGNDRLYGQDGNDELYGESGNDDLVGGSGDDYIKGNDGDDWVSGGDGDDEIHGGDDDDTLNGGDGDDEIRGDDGDDDIKGQEGNDYIIGGAGNDNIHGGGGDDDIRGGSGNDYINGGDGVNIIRGNGGNDTIIVSNLTSSYNGDDGIDTIDFSKLSQGVEIDNANSNSYRNFIVNGNAVGYLDDDFEVFIMTDFDDDIYGFNYADTYYLGSGDDKVISRDGDDLIYGGSGSDNIQSGDDNDRVFGEEGNDYIRGGDGDDYLNGGSGNDTIYGDIGNDRIVTGTGDDKVFAEEGDDVVLIDVDMSSTDEYKIIEGGIGWDTIDYSLVQEGGEFSGASGKWAPNSSSYTHRVNVRDEDIEELFATNYDDEIYVEDGIQIVHGNDGNDRIYFWEGGLAAYGDAGDDKIYGNSGLDIMFGGEGNDTLIGRQGNDELDGGDGDDLLNGGVGMNTLTGGAGSDVFVFDDLEGQNTITDFEHNIDKIDLSAFSNNSIMWSFTSEDFGSMRYNCFSEKEYGTLKFHTVQTGDNVAIYTNMNTDPYVILEGINEEDLTYDDFIF